MKTLMITKSSAVELQHLIVNHESQPIKLNPVMPSQISIYFRSCYFAEAIFL